MVKRFRFLLAFNLLVVILLVTVNPVKASQIRFVENANPRKSYHQFTDTIPPSNIMDVVMAAINSLNSFDIAAVAELYTPNAVVADDEAPYSWNGPTAGVQWGNDGEKACKNNSLTKLKADIQPINVFQQSADNVYIVVPVNFTGNLPG